MNEETPNYNVPPPPMPTPALSVPGDKPEEREPIRGVLSAAEAILRQPRRVIFQLQQPGSGRLVVLMALVVAAVRLARRR